MRQLHNQPSQDKLIQEMTQAGLTQSSIDWMAPYLDASQPERPELLARARRQPVGNQRGAMIMLIVRLLRKNKPEMQNRIIKAFMAAVGPDPLGAAMVQVNRQMPLSARNADGVIPLERLLGPGGALALMAAGWRVGGWVDPQELRMAQPETIKSAMDFCSDPEDPVRMLLACLWLAGQKPKGLLKTLLSGGNDCKWAEETVQEGLIALLPQMVVGAGQSHLKFLADYIRRGKDCQLPVSVQRMNFRYNNPQAGTPATVGAGCFLAMETTPALGAAFILCAALEPDNTLLRTLNLAGEERFVSALPWLTSHTPFHEALSTFARTDRALAVRLAKQYPAIYEKAVNSADIHTAGLLLDVAEEADPAWAQQMRKFNRIGVERGAALGLISRLPANDKAAFLTFMHNGTGLEQLLSRYPLGGQNTWGNNAVLEAYIRDYGPDPFAVRGMIVCAMVSWSSYLASNWRTALKKLSGESCGEVRLLDMAREAGLPPMDCLHLAEIADKGMYSEKDKEELLKGTALWLSKQSDELMAEAAEKGAAHARCAAVLALAQKGKPEALLPLAGDGSKQVRALVVDALASSGQGGEIAQGLLASRKAAQREAALDILSRLDVQAYRSQLETALEKEKSQKLANRMRELLGMTPEETADAAGSTSAGDLVVQTLKGGKKRKVQWALDGLAGPSGEKPVDEDRLAAVMVSCMQGGGVVTAKVLAAPLDQKTLAACVSQVFDLWMEQGAASKQKWVLTFAALFGGREMVDTLKRQINQWPQASRGAIACDAVYALALSPEPEALLLVDSISRKFKFKQVKTAAGRALDAAAQELGLSKEELADRIVPDLGLDQRGSRVFDYGTRSFTVTLAPTLELEVKNQDGKKLKSLPAPGKQDDPEQAGESYEQYKAMKKQIKSTVATQTLRLEQALSTGRTWTAQGWRELFVEKPVMRQFAVGLIWGVYQETGLSATFRYLEDGSLNTADEEEYQLPEQGRVGLVHPIELTAEELETWKQQLEDYEIKQPIEQLNRPVSRLEQGLAESTSLETFGGRVLNGLSLSGKLLGQGWFRGSVEDGGVYYSFYREDGPTGVQLNFSGTYVGGEDDDVVVYDLQFYRAGTVKRGSYVYDAPKGDNLIPLGQVPPRLLSEVVYQVQRATASSAETQEDWKSER